MAYCRFLDDSFRGDVYCYESERGLEIHVAARKEGGPAATTRMDRPCPA